jgi:uncharacterized protein
MPLDLARLRGFAVRRQFPAPTTLLRAIDRLGFVQADPIRAPARAQDLTLRHRVRDYRAGDLERRYARLPIEEDFFVNYGFVTRAVHELMHPRRAARKLTATESKRAANILAFVAERGVVHPREVDAHFAHGTVVNWFGGNSNATTRLLDTMHYRGMLRVARREGGTRLYGVREATVAMDDIVAAMDALVDVIVRKYAPLPQVSLTHLIQRLRYGAPQWATARRDALARAKARLSRVTVDGVTYYWPAEEQMPSRRIQVADEVRFLAPFDPLVWDRPRFEHFYGWAYRFEAYTPAPKRVRGYYALPLLWRDSVIGWANVSARDGAVTSSLGYVSGAAPKEPAFATALDAEIARMETFLRSE